MTTDCRGLAHSGATAEALHAFDAAIDSFNRYRGDPVALLTTALDHAPDFAMARIARAWLLALSTEPAGIASAREDLDNARPPSTDARAASHVTALNAVLAGNWNAAGIRLDRHLAEYPRDLLALQCGHLIDFYRGNARDLRDRIARALPHWSPDLPGYAFVQGMYAFGLEECGDYARAEEAGRAAIDREPGDSWAHHAVTHVMEMQGRAQDGIGWMIAREADWSTDDNFFQVHNWWHRALFHLDLGQTKAALALYDGPVRSGRSQIALDMVDASALLWRLHLAGVDVGDRWAELATAWDAHADGTTYPFNDWHAAMALLGAGRDTAVSDLRRVLQRSGADANEVAGWAASVALPLIDGFAAFWHGRYADAVDHLYPVRFRANRFGGSHAQRDIIDCTLTEAALRGGDSALAAALAHERLALKPHSPMNRGFAKRAAHH